MTTVLRPNGSVIKSTCSDFSCTPVITPFRSYVRCCKVSPRFILKYAFQKPSHVGIFLAVFCWKTVIKMTVVSIYPVQPCLCFIKKLVVLIHRSELFSQLSFLKSPVNGRSNAGGNGESNRCDYNEIFESSY